MHQSFYFSSKVHNFMLENVSIDSLKNFMFLCAALALISVCSEGMRVVRSHLSRTVVRKTLPSLINRVQFFLDREAGRTSESKIRFSRLFLESLMHIIYISVGYILMLSVMTFNAYFLISILLGTGIGYFLFGSFDALLRAPLSPYLLPGSCNGFPRVVRRKKSNACRQKAGNKRANKKGGQQRAKGGNIRGSSSTSDNLRLLRPEDLEQNDGNYRPSDANQGLLAEQVTVDVHA